VVRSATESWERLELESSRSRGLRARTIEVLHQRGVLDCRVVRCADDMVRTVNAVPLVLAVQLVQALAVPAIWVLNEMNGLLSR
jgi:hypothetical protein